MRRLVLMELTDLLIADWSLRRIWPSSHTTKSGPDKSRQCDVSYIKITESCSLSNELFMLLNYIHILSGYSDKTIGKWSILKWYEWVLSTMAKAQGQENGQWGFLIHSVTLQCKAQKCDHRHFICILLLTLK